MPRILVLVTAALLLGLNGCAGLGLTQPQGTRRYKRVYVYAPPSLVPDTPVTTPLWERDWIDVSVFSIPATPAETPPRDVFALAAEGQAAFIQALAARSPDLATLTRSVAVPIRREAQPESNRDMGVVKRRVVFSVANRSMSPADRLASVRITLRPQAGVRLIGWDKLATAYESIDVGTMTFTQKVTGGAELGAVLDAVTPKVTGSSEAGLEEQLPLRERLVALTGTLTPDSATLLQHSTAGRDLTGNIIVDLEMDLTTEAAQTLAFVTYPEAAGGKIECAQPPVFRFQFVQVPANADREVKATLYVDYVVRRVSQGHATLYEGDDVVHQVHVADTIPNVTLIPERDLRVLSWRLVARGRGPLAIQQVRPSTRPQTLQFGSYESAVRLRDWIAVCGLATLTEYDFLLNGALVDRATKPNLIIAPFWLNRPNPGAAPPPPN
jgi:hypothetical protein